MTKLRLPVSSLLISCMLILALTTGAGDALAAPARPVFKGEDFYRGIFLAQGPVANRIPEIRDHLKIDQSKVDPKVMRLINDFYARLIDSIREADPTFMDRFGEAMQSGDHFAIEEMIAEGSNVTLKAMHEMPEVVSLRAKIEEDPTYVDKLIDRIKAESKVDVPEDALRQAINIAVAGRMIGDPTANTVVVVALAAAVVVVAATYITVVHSVAGVFSVAGAVALATWFAAFWCCNANDLPQKTLFREQMIDSIARLRY